MRYVITEYNRVRQKALHIVNLGGSPLEIHNQARSLKTFRSKTAGDKGRMDRWFLVKEYDEYFNARERRDMALREQLPLVEATELVLTGRDEQFFECSQYNILWEFYESVGYNHVIKALV